MIMLLNFSFQLFSARTYTVLPYRLSPIIPLFLGNKMLTTLLPILLLAAQAANGAILPHLYDGYSFIKPLPSSSKPCSSSASLGGNKNVYGSASSVRTKHVQVMAYSTVHPTSCCSGSGMCFLEDCDDNGYSEGCCGLPG
jgi:hypothetical protein